MLSIYVNDQALDLGADFSITFNFKSPVFNETGSYSYPIKLPFTHRNAAILNFKHRVENTGDPWQEFPCRIEVEGRFLLGLFKCTIGNTAGFEGAVYALNGDFNYKIKDKELQSILPDIIPAGLDYINDCRNYDYPNRPVAFPYIKDLTFFDPPLTDWWRTTFNNYFFNSNIDIGDLTYGYSLIVPFFYLKYVLKRLCEVTGYNLENIFFDSHPDFNRLLIFNCVNINGLIGGTNQIWGLTVNTIYSYLHLPQILIKDFIVGLEKLWNIRFFINTTTQKVKICSLDSIIKDQSYTEFSKDIISKSVEPSDKLSGYHLKMALDSTDPLTEPMNTSEDELLKNLKSPVDWLIDLPKFPLNHYGDIRYVRETNLYYIWDYISWGVLSDQNIGLWSQYLYKDYSQDIESKFSAIGAFDDMISVGNKQSDCKEVSPRLFFAKKDLTWGAHIPVWGSDETDDHMLWYHGANGLFEKYFKTWLDWLVNAKKVKTTKQATWSEICDIDFSKKYMMHGVKSLISSVQVTIKPNSISPCLIEHYPCP